MLDRFSIVPPNTGTVMGCTIFDHELIETDNNTKYNIYIKYFTKSYLIAEAKSCIHSPSSFSFSNSCALVGRAYIPAATAFLITHPWWGANTCA